MIFCDVLDVGWNLRDLGSSFISFNYRVHFAKDHLIAHVVQCTIHVPIPPSHSQWTRGVHPAYKCILGKSNMSSSARIERQIISRLPPRLGGAHRTHPVRYRHISISVSPPAPVHMLYLDNRIRTPPQTFTDEERCMNCSNAFDPAVKVGIAAVCCSTDTWTDTWKTRVHQSRRRSLPLAIRLRARCCNCPIPPIPPPPPLGSCSTDYPKS